MLKLTVENSLENTIVLARHGQTDYNVEGKIQDPINPHLTEIGHQQAQKLHHEIENMGLKFDLVICPDTSRNLETLKEIYPNYDQMEHVKVDPRLQERYHKDLVGKTKTEIEVEIGSKFPNRLSYHLYFEGTDKSLLTNKNYSNDETLESIQQRLRSLLNDIKGKGNVLLLGSSVTNQYILEYLKYGTIGEKQPQTPDGKEIDFQDNEELRIITVDKDMRMKKFTSKHF